MKTTSKNTGRYVFIHLFWNNGRCSAVVNTVMNMYIKQRGYEHAD
jgi:hypothetical protein